jgi:hypothetical protein
MLKRPRLQRRGWPTLLTTAILDGAAAAMPSRRMKRGNSTAGIRTLSTY